MRPHARTLHTNHERKTRHVRRITAAEAAAETRPDMSTLEGLLRIDGREYGMARDIAARLTTEDRPITAQRIRDWARRSRREGDRLYGLLPGVRLPGARTGTTWYDLQHAAYVARLTSG